MHSFGTEIDAQACNVSYVFHSSLKTQFGHLEKNKQYCFLNCKWKTNKLFNLYLKFTFD